MTAEYTVFLNNAFGYRAACVSDFIKLSYTMTTSGEGGGFRLDLLSTFDMSLVQLGGFVEIYRSVDGRWPCLEDVYLIQSIPQAQARRGTRFYSLEGGSLTKAWLGGNARVVAHLAGEAGDAKTDTSDNAAKYYIAQTLGNGAGSSGDTFGRDLSQLYGLTVEPYRSLGPSVTISGAFRPLKDVLAEIKRKSEEDATNPKRLYWTIRPKSFNPLQFEVVTFVDIYGVDRSATSVQPVYLAMEFGTLMEVDQDYDYREAWPSVYVRYAGGASSTRVTDTASDRLYAYPAAFAEAVYDATASGTSAAAQAAAKSKLNEGKPRRLARVKTLDSEVVRDGVEYCLGDRVAVIALDRSYTAEISGIDTTVERGSPHGTRVLRVEEIT